MNAGVERAISELDVETLDHVSIRIPEQILHTSGKLSDALKQASETLEELCQTGKIQSYGFAVSSSADLIEPLIQSTFAPLATQFGRFASLQLPVNLTSAAMPLSAALKQFKEEQDMLVIAEKPFEAILSNGKPLILRSYRDHTGEDVALLLKSAFNLALSVERKYMETVLPENSSLKLPPAEEVAWAHILANQHGQFENAEEWNFILETQILPRFDLVLKELSSYEETKELGFAYSIALRELLKCFTLSIEVRQQLSDALNSCDLSLTLLCPGQP